MCMYVFSECTHIRVFSYRFVTICCTIGRHWRGSPRRWVSQSLCLQTYFMRACLVHAWYQVQNDDKSQRFDLDLWYISSWHVCAGIVDFITLLQKSILARWRVLTLVAGSDQDTHTSCHPGDYQLSIHCLCCSCWLYLFLISSMFENQTQDLDLGCAFACILFWRALNYQTEPHTSTNASGFY